MNLEPNSLLVLQFVCLPCEYPSTRNYIYKIPNLNEQKTMLSMNKA